MFTHLTPDFIAPLIKLRAADSHKGTYGHALIIAGSKGRMGASVLAAMACLRTGSGLLTVEIPEEERCILQTSVPEAMLLFRENGARDNSVFSAAGIGPAIGTNASTVTLTDLLQQFHKPVVLDADALTILSQQKDLFRLIPPNAVLTPHPKEFDRLFGEHASLEERAAKAITLSKLHPWTIVLKGHQTLIATDGRGYQNTTGNAGLAKGGSGDVLTGMITALLAQGYSSLVAAQVGIFLHGRAADIAVKKQSMESLLARDVIENIGAAFQSLHPVL